MSFFTNACTDESPYWACFYNYTLHPLYHQCDQCPDRHRCDKAILPPLREENIPADCPRTGCLNCPRPLLGTCHFFDRDKPAMRKKKAAEPNCNYQCRRCSKAWSCEMLQEHLNLLGMLEVLRGEDVVDYNDKSFWKITHGCPHDERCVSCADIVHCYPLSLHRTLSPR